MAVLVDHYQRLGVAPSASTEEIRVAYRALAAKFHPDRAMSGSQAELDLAERRMREINESWSVLHDPMSRRRYDDARVRERQAASREAAGGPPRPGPLSERPRPQRDDLVDVAPPGGLLPAGVFRHLPWVLLVVVFALIFVVTAYAAKDDPAPEAPVTAEQGSCIDVYPGPSTTIVGCDGPHELVVVERVVSGEPCPAGTEVRRFGVDDLVDCVRPD